MRIIEIWPDHVITEEIVDGRMQCNTLAYKKRFWEDLIVIGPDLIERKVLSVEDPQKEKSDFMGWTFGNRSMSVRPVLDEGKPITIDQLKQRIIADMHDESVWASAGDPAIYREHTAKAQSFDDVWEIMNGEYWNKICYDPSGFATDASGKPMPDSK